MATILAIHAHPDDIEVLAAGALAILAERGHAVQIITATAGEGGAVDSDPKETAEIRTGEAEVSASLIGASYVCAGIPDLSVFNDDPTRRLVTELIRAATPDIVIAPASDDYHPDHEAVSSLVRDACFASSVPNYLTGPSPALRAIPHLYLMDPIGGRSRDGRHVVADFGVDIAASLATKGRMLAAHASQVDWIAKQHGVQDQIGDMERWAKRRGRDFGVAAAEGFRQYRHHPYPTTPMLQELLAGALLTAKAD